jgi:hypothetical protein
MDVGGRSGSRLTAIPSGNVQRLVEASALYSWADLRHDRALPPEAPGVYVSRELKIPQA